MDADRMVALLWESGKVCGALELGGDEDFQALAFVRVESWGIPNVCVPLETGGVGQGVR